MNEKTIAVRYYTCNCEETSWITKYCDDHHTAYARIPMSVLETYTGGRGA